MLPEKAEKIPVSSFNLPVDRKLDPQNRWVILANVLPWEDFEATYNKLLCDNNGRPALPSRLVVGALILKHQLVMSDVETILQIQENIYMQYFVGLVEFQTEQIFTPSLFVEIRKRLGDGGIGEIEASIAKGLRKFQVEKSGKHKQPVESKAEEPKSDESKSDEPEQDDSKPDEPKLDDPKPTNEKPGDPKIEKPLVPTKETHNGHLKLDATVAPQKIKYPTDLDLLNSARVKVDEYIDLACIQLKLPRGNYRTYRRKARKEFLNVSKKKKKSTKEIREGIRKQLGYLSRNLLYIKELISKIRATDPEANLDDWSKKDIEEYNTIQKLYTQQSEMYDAKRKSCADRIVSISQPYVRPIVRGKAHVNTEFGAKIGLSTYNGITTLDNFSWDAYNENADFKTSIQKYKTLWGVYPETINCDRIYLNRTNRALAKQLGIRVIGKPLGRPKKIEQTSKEKLADQAERNQRNVIEGKIGQSKNRYGLDKIPAKTDVTTGVWVSCCIIATNLARWLKEIFFCLYEIRRQLCYNNLLQTGIRLKACV